MKSIDTLYNGNYFRSRMEARWAVFFDAAGIEYQYEPEGFDVGEGFRYLPDFYLPQFKVYAEVKPGPITHETGIMDHPDYRKWALFTEEKELIFLIGNPHPHPFLKMPFQDYDTFSNWCEFMKDGYYSTATSEYFSFWRFWYAPSDPYGDHASKLERFVTEAIVKRFEHGAK